ncbi:hypothetical protein [Rummeliibacillus sp. BSL5]
MKSMKKDYDQFNKEEINKEVSAQGLPKETNSVSVNYDSPLAGYMQSARIDILGGVAKVTATNTGNNDLKVSILSYKFAMKVVKSWTVKPGATLNTGEFSITGDTYALRVGRASDSYPTTGRGTLYGITYL